MRRFSTLPRRALELSRIRPPLPTGPGCSRWLSCTCCARTAATSARHKAAPAEERTRPSLSTLQQMRAPHLPLPPPLPWSPDSPQFLRHLQILTQALLSRDPEDSWGIYDSLHPDVRPAVPDDVFVSLLRQQARRDKGKRRARVFELVDLARKCGMGIGGIDPSTLREAARSLLAAEPGETWTTQEYEALDWIWDALGDETITQSSGKVLRQRWLTLAAYRYRDDYESAHAALEELVQRGATGITAAAEAILALRTGDDRESSEKALRLAAWCLARDITVHETALVELLGRIRDASAEDGVQAALGAGDALVAELKAGRAYDPALKLQAAVDFFRKANLTTLERARTTAQAADAPVNRLWWAAEKLLRKPEPSAADLEVAVQLCTRALQEAEVPHEYEKLLDVTARHLSRLRSYDLGVTLARSVLNSEVLRSNIMALSWPTVLLNTVLLALPSPNAYETARKFYPRIRAAAKHSWDAGSGRHWRRFFDMALHRGEIHFASRLYADFQADGLTVPRACLLQFIKVIASKPSQSRFILLERHIKDYLWDEEQPTDDLVVAIAQGLSSTGRPDDAAMAVAICQRICDSLPTRAVEALIKPLVTSRDAQHRGIAYKLLMELPVEDAPRSMSIALASLSKNVPPSDIGELVTLCRKIVERGVPASIQMASSLVHAFLNAGQWDRALAIFHAAAADGQAIKSHTVGQLMLALAQAGRCDEAYAVETKWRALFPSGVDYDKGVRGARLAVDILAGKDIDLSVYLSRDGQLRAVDGYKPVRRYFDFLQKIKRAASAERAPATDPAGTEETCVAEGRGAEVEGVQGKTAVSPLTRSWRRGDDDSRSEAWLLDPPRRRGVDMCGVRVV